MTKPKTQSPTPKDLDRVEVYTDGGSRGNPGPAAVGVVIRAPDGTVINEYGEKLEGEMTNNEAEYAAVISALKKMKALFGKEKTKQLVVQFYVDSELIAKQLMGEYKVEQEHLQLLYMKVHNLRFNFKEVTFTPIPREKNTHADKLLNEALDAEESKLF